jgi:hypothetical protein
LEERSMKAINAIRMGGVDVLPLVEGGKGVAISNGESSGTWASTGGVGTFSAVNADSYDETGKPIPQTYSGRTRRERHEELIAYAIRGGITQAQKAYELAGARGRPGRRQGPDQRHHLRRRHAVPSLRHRTEIQYPLLPDRLLGPRLQRAVEARL